MISQPTGPTHLSGALRAAKKKELVVLPAGIMGEGLEGVLHWALPMKAWTLEMKKYLAELALVAVARRGSEVLKAQQKIVVVGSTHQEAHKFSSTNCP
eukprot:6213109-Amphidinium_carterae.2